MSTFSVASQAGRRRFDPGRPLSFQALSQQEVERFNVCWRLGTSIAERTAIFEEGRRVAEEAGDVRAQAAPHGTYGCALGRYAG